MGSVPRGTAMPAVFLLAAAAASSLEFPTAGVYTVEKGTLDYDRIIPLEGGQSILLEATGSFVATPAYRTRQEVEYGSLTVSCTFSGDVHLPDGNTQGLLREYEQAAVFAPWPMEEQIELGDCKGSIRLENSGTRLMLVFLGGANDQRGIAEFLSHGAAVFWFHGVWNELGWTYPVILVACLLAVVVGFAITIRCNGPQIMLSKRRYWCYIAAIAAFAAGAIEGIVHVAVSTNKLLVATTEAEAYAVTIAPNVAAIALCLIVVYGRYGVLGGRTWALVELGVVFGLLCFWVGLYVGPAALACAAIVRLAEGPAEKLVAFGV